MPGGTSLVLQPPEGPASFDWTANVAQETFMMFMLVDSQGRQGGSSDVRLVGNSNDNASRRQLLLIFRINFPLVLLG